MNKDIEFYEFSFLNLGSFVFDDDKLIINLVDEAAANGIDVPQFIMNHFFNNEDVAN